MTPSIDMTDMEIRATARADIAAVDDLLARSYPALLKADYPASVMLLALPLISRAQPELVLSGTFYGAFKEDVLLGAGGWTKAPPGRGRGRADVAHIRHFVTDPAYTRQGVASAIMNHCLQEARASGAREMMCQATYTAVPFYGHMGFEALGEITVPLRAGIDFPAIRMRRAL